MEVQMFNLKPGGNSGFAYYGLCFFNG